MVAYNWVIMKTVGVAGLAAFTIIGYVAYVFNMVIIGFGQSASPLISFAYGAQDLELSKTVRKKTTSNPFSSTGRQQRGVLQFLTSRTYFGTIFV
jgi:MatE.